MTDPRPLPWLTRPWVRVALIVVIGLILVSEWPERGLLFWLGILVIGMQVIALAVGTQPARAGADSESGSANVNVDDDSEASIDVRLVELLDRPEVAAAVAEAPSMWRQVSYLEDELEPVPLTELAEDIWVSLDGEGWTVAVGDELKPYLDLDVDEEDDPLVQALVAHPAFAIAYHEDREVYRAEPPVSLPVEEFAALAVRGLTRHHLAAVERLDRP